MEKLRPTVKRDLSLFSVQAWQEGYNAYFQDFFNWWYDIFFHYDGSKVNFYHRLSDFDYFKNIITENLLGDDDLFNNLNRKFQISVKKLQKFINNVDFRNIKYIYGLIGQIMFFYMFIVSDDVVERKPVAWKSRHMSEGLLYIIDEQIESHIKKLLKGLNLIHGISHYLTFKEILLLTARRLEHLDFEEIKQRSRGYILHNDNLITNISFKQFCRENNLINPEDGVTLEEVEVLQGQTACPGKTKGTVKIIENKNDFVGFAHDDIVVSIMTNATIVPLMKKASAIITDKGGITCHAAIVSRELKIPCIIGTKIATQVLKDGDLVEVDANKGIVKILKK